jgi:hypothetical protein
MVHAQALVRTDRPSRHAAQLAERLGHEMETEWSAEAGYVKLPEGICDMHSWPEGLRLDAFAENDEKLRRVEDEVRSQLQRLSDGDRLEIEWYRRPLSG